MQFSHVLIALILVLTAYGDTTPLDVNSRLLTLPEDQLSRRRLFFGNLFGSLVGAIEDFADATGIDNVVHSVTGGYRVLEKDGSLSDELTELGEDIVGAIVRPLEELADVTGVDNIVHMFSGGNRLINRDGSYNPDFVNHVKDEALKLLVGASVEEAKEVARKLANGFETRLREYFEGLSNGPADFANVVKTFWDTFSPYPTPQEVMDLGEAFLNAKSDDEFKNAVSKIVAARFQKGAMAIRHILGLVDLGVLTFGANVNTEFSFGIGVQATAGALFDIPLISKDCPDMQTKSDHPGNDLNLGGKHGRVKGHLTRETCLEVCLKTIGCAGYTFVETEPEGEDNCNLKKSWDQNSVHQSDCCVSQEIIPQCKEGLAGVDFATYTSVDFSAGVQAELELGGCVTLSLNTPAKTSGGWAVGVSIGGAFELGVDFDFSWAIQESGELKLSTISVCGNVGAGFDISATVGYTYVLTTIADFPLPPIAVVPCVDKECPDLSPSRCNFGNGIQGSIAGHNLECTLGLSHSECQRRCDQNPLCRSVDIKNENGNCCLQDCAIGDGSCVDDENDSSEWTHYSCQPLRCKFGNGIQGSIAGHNLECTLGLSRSECQRRCDQNPLCRSVDIKNENGNCCLQDCAIGDGSCLDDENDSSEWTHYSCEQPCAIRRDIDFAGSDIDFIPNIMSAEDCEFECARFDGCDSWTWVKQPGWPNSKNCYVKSGQPRASSSDCCDSGNSFCATVDPEVCGLARDTDFAGSDIHSFPNVRSAVECASKCAKFDGCDSWTWVKQPGLSNSNFCYMKSGEPSATSSNCCDSGKACGTGSELNDPWRCGSDWVDANTKCGATCTTQEDCPDGESCFAFLDPCSA